MKNWSRTVLCGIAIAFAVTSTAFAQDGDDPYHIPDGTFISYTKDIHPIFKKKCIACHACFDSPAQLSLTNALGVERGAFNFDPYLPHFKSLPYFYYLARTDKTVEDYRRIGFFSVTEGGKDSVMGQILKLGYDNQWKPNQPIPKHIELDGVTRKLTAPNRKEFIGYAAAKPHQGMPYAVAGLTKKEYATVMTWLERGAKLDPPPLPGPTNVEEQEIANWETFLNKPDLEHKLVGRYVYEHMEPLHFYFDNDSPTFWHMVRSATPPGQPVQVISTRGIDFPIEQPFWYRMKPVSVELHYKRHMPIDATNNRLAKHRKMLFEIPFKATRLPGHTFAERRNPLRTFQEIPAKNRYKFMLLDAFLYDRMVRYGSSCRSGFAVSAGLENDWITYEDPDTSLYCNDAEYREAVTPLLDSFDLVPRPTAYFASLANTEERTRKMIEKRAEGMMKHPGVTSIDAIWKGYDPDGPPAVLTGCRNDGNAGSINHYVLGDYPDRMRVMDLGIMERRVYGVVVTFDLFGDNMYWEGRMEVGLMRLFAEINYLRFLPKEARPIELAKIYKRGAKDPEISQFLSSNVNDIPTSVKYETKNYRREFMDKVIAHFDSPEHTTDPINRPKPGDKVTPVQAAFRKISTTSKNQREQGHVGFKAFLAEATIIRVDDNGKLDDMYTMTLDWDIAKSSYTGNLFERPDPNYDRVTIYNTILTGYPNFMFRVEKADVPEFADTLLAAETRGEFLKVVDRWGVRRTNPDFWDVFHSIEEFIKRTNPRQAAILDMNRYIDY